MSMVYHDDNQRLGRHLWQTGGSYIWTKLHHAAASVLVGWYLITPPIKGASVELRAPLAEWIIESRHDSAAECRKAKKEETEEIVSPQTGWSVSTNSEIGRAHV